MQPPNHEISAIFEAFGDVPLKFALEIGTLFFIELTPRQQAHFFYQEKLGGGVFAIKICVN